MGSEYFKTKEIECRCGCKAAHIHPEFLAMLNEIRKELGSPMHVNSCVRCESHNSDVGGVRGSSHLIGAAADIKFHPGEKQYDCVRIAMAKGVRQIGIYSTFVHLGNDYNKPRLVFRGKY